MDLDSAIKAHAEWKVKFRAAIQGKQQLDASSISKDNLCPLGQWLHGEARAKYAGLKSYGKCVHDHALCCGLERDRHRHHQPAKRSRHLTDAAVRARCLRVSQVPQPFTPSS